ncbi:PREDICTED: WAT1-related protein At5g07050-like [Nelumbo nucifera]|uniref:WAT1-related protein n=1 Tax=Nelumbo nucifera TaxID=4432 RepID=A0A1U8AEY3_NELNU|nr:PREDICTED: WAT1-related protein At5g07050-like [Nelumbo nucifera]
MNLYVLVVYGHAIGMLTTALLALLFESFEMWKIKGVLGVWTNRPKITLPVLSNIFFLGITGMEKLNITRFSSQAKIGGTLVAFAGAAFMTLYKGIVVISFSSPHSAHSSKLRESSEKDWMKGSLLLIVSYVSQAAFYILQAPTIKKYPAPLSLTSLTCLVGTLQAAIVTVIVDHKASSWRLNWDITLLSPIYCGVMIFGVTIYIQTVVVKKRGPVFLTAFRPLGTVIVAIMALLILKEALHLGSILGAVMMFAGLYMVLWGKEKEKGDKPTARDLADQVEQSKSSNVEEISENIVNV